MAGPGYSLAAMKSLLDVMLDFKNAPGKHDQQEHGSWAEGLNAAPTVDKPGARAAHAIRARVRADSAPPLQAPAYKVQKMNMDMLSISKLATEAQRNFTSDNQKRAVNALVGLARQATNTAAMKGISMHAARDANGKLVGVSVIEIDAKGAVWIKHLFSSGTVGYNAAHSMIQDAAMLALQQKSTLGISTDGAAADEKGFFYNIGMMDSGFGNTVMFNVTKTRNFAKMGNSAVTPPGEPADIDPPPPPPEPERPKIDWNYHRRTPLPKPEIAPISSAPAGTLPATSQVLDKSGKPVGEYKTIEEAEAAMKQYFPNVRLGLKDMHIDCINSTCKAVYKVLNDPNLDPAMFRRLYYVGTPGENGRKFFKRNDGEEAGTNFGITEQTVDAGQVTGYNIYLNPKWFKDPEKYLKASMECSELKERFIGYTKGRDAEPQYVLSRFHPECEGDKPVEATVIHELGHVFKFQMEKDLGDKEIFTTPEEYIPAYAGKPCDFKTILNAAYESNYKLVRNGGRNGVGGGQLSTYSVKNRDEYFAESFSVMFNGNDTQRQHVAVQSLAGIIKVYNDYKKKTADEQKA